MDGVDRLPVVVVGAGAAGLMAAIHAAAGARPVLLLEGSERPGQKILISGGGRCNVLPSQASHTDFVSDSSPNLVRKVLAAWPLAEVRRFFEADLGVSLKLEAETGKLFPVSDRARTVLDALMAAYVQRGGRLRIATRVTDLRREDDCWAVQLSSGEMMRAASVILATGGLSVPATGSDGAGLCIARELGHAIVPTYPALVPLTGSNPAHRALAGMSVRARVWASDEKRWTIDDRRLSNGKGGQQATIVRRPSSMVSPHGGFLFTHRGYSGPAVLNISHAVTRAMAEDDPRPLLLVQWTDLDAAAWDALLRAGSGPTLPLLRRHLPERLAAQLLGETGLGQADLSRLRREDRARLVDALTRYPLPWAGSEGYKTAEVTGGGVSLAEVNPATLESRRVPGLYLCGELLDAFGPIGGYNFLWAWVTGCSAGRASSEG
jgi:predicted flavoprotein YhiN